MEPPLDIRQSNQIFDALHIFPHLFIHFVFVEEGIENRHICLVDRIENVIQGGRDYLPCVFYQGGGKPISRFHFLLPQ